MTLLRPEQRAHLALVIAMLLWGSSFVALKIAILEANPMIVVFGRMAIACLVFLALVRVVRPHFHYRKGDWKALAALALCEPCLYFVFEALALQYTSAAQAGVVTATLPVLIAVAAVIFLKEQIQPRQWLGLSIALIGVLWMSWDHQASAHAPNAMLGNFLEFLAMCMAVGYTLIAKVLMARYSAFAIAALQSMIGMLFFLPLAALVDWPESLSAKALSSIIYLGAVVSLGAYGLYNYALASLSASTSGAYVNLIPVAAVLFAMLILDERLQWSQWLACGLIFAGVYIGRAPARYAQPAAS